jgi:methionine transaminase
VGTTIFTVMSKMAAEHNAINLSQGFPDFPCSPELMDLVCSSMKKGFNQYAPMPGLPALREGISEKTNLLYGYKPDVDKEITVTSGATEALFDAITAVVKSGDEVIIFEPAYDSYIPAILLAGGIPVPVELEFPDYSIDWGKVKKLINSKTKLIIINSPHNPTGAVFSESDLTELENCIYGTGVIVISDEVYEHIIFDGLRHQSVLLRPDLRKRAFVISSFGKTFHTTGWKIGYCIAPEKLSAEFRKVHQFVTFSSSTPFQQAIAEFIKDKENYLHLPDYYQKKRDYFFSLMKNSPLKQLPCSGTYFALYSFAHLFSEGDVEMAEKLTRDIGVASIPVSVFYAGKTDNKVLRFCFAKENSTLEKAAEKLCRI